MNSKPIPPKPRQTQTFDPFDATPSERRKADASIGHDEDALTARQDPWFFQNLARTDRYGK